jgi:hypothetical protein
VAFCDTFAVWAIHGVRVTEQIVMRPESLSIKHIQTERNTEIKRVMIERYGQSRYLIDSGAHIVHQDDFGTLYRAHVPNDEDLVMVNVINATPEPDGSFHDYFLRVPPTCQTALEAVAWTFDERPDDYAQIAVQT